MIIEQIVTVRSSNCISCVVIVIVLQKWESYIYVGSHNCLVLDPLSMTKEQSCMHPQVNHMVVCASPNQRHIMVQHWEFQTNTPLMNHALRKHYLIYMTQTYYGVWGQEFDHATLLCTLVSKGVNVIADVRRGIIFGFCKEVGHARFVKRSYCLPFWNQRTHDFVIAK